MPWSFSGIVVNCVYWCCLWKQINWLTSWLKQWSDSLTDWMKEYNDWLAGYEGWQYTRLFSPCVCLDYEISERQSSSYLKVCLHGDVKRNWHTPRLPSLISIIVWANAPSKTCCSLTEEGWRLAFPVKLRFTICYDTDSVTVNLLVSVKLKLQVVMTLYNNNVFICR